MLNFCWTSSFDRISSRSRAMLRNDSGLFFCAILSGSFAVVLCNTWQSDAPIDLNSSSGQSTASVLLSNLSVLSTLTSIISPSSDHACIHKCKSDKKFRNYLLSLLPSQFLGMRSLIRDGLEAVDFAETFWSAVLMLFKMSTLPLTISVHFQSQLLYHVCHFLSQFLLK